MDSQNNPFGWFGNIQTFLSLSKPEWITSLQEHHLRCMNCPEDVSQKAAWDHEFDILQIELKKLLIAKPNTGNFSLIFEYELPRERGRRPDVIILGSSTIFVLEFKDYSKILQAHVDQVDAYARDLKHYHAESQPYTVLPVLVLARAKDLNQNYDTISVVSADSLCTYFVDIISSDTLSLIEPIEWIQSDYSPLPSLIEAARMLWDDKKQLPQIRQANNNGIPQTIAELFTIAEKAKQNNELHLAFVTGVPGAGKTLVGIRLVYENHLDESNKTNNAVFLSGNGPLVEVLQHALKNKFFIQDVFGFLKQYGGEKTSLPREHIWIFDEAQRAWDAEQVKIKRGHATSEPEDFLKLAERKNSWILIVALIGEGQEIYTGEESGLPQWNVALLKMQKKWIIHTPEKIANIFSPSLRIETNNVLDLTRTLRSHLAEKVTRWVEALLDGDLVLARTLANILYSQGFDLYLTNDITVATNYVKERYRSVENKRFGFLASSKANNLSNWGIPNDFLSTRKMKKTHWYNDPPTSFLSCCSLRDVATEFACQGLELDFPIVCWGNDFIWDGSWKSQYSKKTEGSLDKPVSITKTKIGPFKKSKQKNPHQLRVNSYRVLLTRGRDGFIVFVPNEIGMQSTYEALKLAGVREISGIGLNSKIDEKVFSL